MFYGIVDEDHTLKLSNLISYEAKTDDFSFDSPDEFTDTYGGEWSTDATFAIWDYDDVKNVDDPNGTVEPLATVKPQMMSDTFSALIFDGLDANKTYVIMQIDAPDGCDNYEGQWWQFLKQGDGIRFDCNNHSFSGDVVTAQNPFWFNVKSKEPPAEDQTPTDDTDQKIGAKLTIEQTFDVEKITNARVGDVVRLNYVLTNDGDVAVHDIVATNSLGSTITLEKTELQPGESTNGYADYELTDEDIVAELLNSTASATGVDESNQEVKSNEDTDEIPIELTANENANENEAVALGDDTNENANDVAEDPVPADDLMQTGAVNFSAIATGFAAAIGGVFAAITRKVSNKR